jgi:hypothetical protein
MSAFRQWLLLCASQNRCYSNLSRPRRLVTFRTKKYRLARLNAFLACVGQTELGAQLQIYQAVVRREIVGKLQTRILREVIVQKFLIVAVIAKRRGVTARIRVQPNTEALSIIRVETEVQHDTERRAEIEVPHASWLVRHEETEVHVTETRNTDTN